MNPKSSLWETLIKLCKESLVSLLIAFQVILGEEVAASKLTIFDLAQQICDAFQARADIGEICFSKLFKSCYVCFLKII